VATPPDERDETTASSTGSARWLDRFREDNRMLAEMAARLRLRKVWIYAGLLTMLTQLQYRAGHDCTDATACTVSMAKGLLWSAFWPVYWIMKATDFTLAKAIFSLLR